MLIENYYKVNDIIAGTEKTLFIISLNPDCEVYEGHFPGIPISPGACNIQMIKECAESIAGKHLFMNNLQHCRLTTLITPLVYPQVEVTIFMEKKADVYKLKATIGKGEEIYLELKAELIEDTYKTN